MSPKKSNTVITIIAVIVFIFMAVLIRYYTGMGILWSGGKLIERFTTPLSIGFFLIPLIILIFLKRKKNISMFGYLLVVLILISAYNVEYIIDHSPKSSTNQTSSDFSQNDTANNTVISIVKSMLSGSNVSKYEITESSHGKLAPLVKWFNEYAIKLQEQFKNMNDEIEQLNIDGAFNLTALKQSSNLPIAMDKLNRAYSIVNKYELSYLIDLENAGVEWEKIVKGLDIPDYEKDRMMKSRKDEEVEKDLAIKKVFTNLKDAFKAKIDYVAWLQKNQNNYTLSGERITLNTEKSMSEYSKLISRVSETANEVIRYQESIRNEYNKKLTGAGK